MIDFHEDKALKAIEALERGGADAFLLFPGADIGYYTGFTIGPSERLAAALIPFDRDPVLIVNELEKALRGQNPWITDVEIWREHEDPIDLLARNIERLGLDKAVIGVAEDAPWGWVNRLKERVPEAHFVDATRFLSQVRMVKAPQELEWMRMACAITDRALEVAFEHLRTGMTEKELADIIAREMLSRGGRMAFCIVLFGDRAALPHGRPSDRELKPGDVVLVDTGATVHGYYSDLTRTVFYGVPTKRHREIYGVVCAANRAAYEAVRPGITCDSLDAIGRKVIDDAGFSDYFIHRLGHGIGLQDHEHPYIVRNNGLELEPGMTFTIEPGIYIIGEIGVRVEDTVVCTPEGCERLTRLSRELTSYRVRG
jgi:Xaa-Pro aminopeptidase